MSTLEAKQMLLVMDFVQGARVGPLGSTGAKEVTVPDAVYNVEGSEGDPKKVEGKVGDSWKKLLQDCDIGTDDECYVNEGEGSHPHFNDGGHVTTDEYGRPLTATTCYLMPLCAWHNSIGRNRMKFEHKKQKMLLLSGYNVKTIAATFMLRLPSPELYAVLYFTGGGWRSKNLSEHQAQVLRNGALGALDGDAACEYAFLFKRDPQTQSLSYVDEFSSIK